MYKELMTKKKLKETPMEKVFNNAGIFFCMVCKKGFYDDENLVSVKETSRCLKCDHIEGEIQDDKMYGNQDLPF